MRAHVELRAGRGVGRVCCPPPRLWRADPVGRTEVVAKAGDFDGVRVLAGDPELRLRRREALDQLARQVADAWQTRTKAG